MIRKEKKTNIGSDINAVMMRTILAVIAKWASDFDASIIMHFNGFKHKKKISHFDFFRELIKFE